MAIGSNIASTFNIPQRQSAIGPRDIIQRGLAAEQELYGGPGPSTPELPEDMAQIEDLTSEIQNQWFEAKNFANTMWHNYRIDVTKPDSRNPLSIQANQTYMKALAAIQHGGLKLKDKNKQLALTDKEVAEGRGVYVQDPRKQLYDRQSQYFSSRTQDPTAQQSNIYDGTDKNTTKAYKQSLAQTTAKRAEMLRQAGEAERTGDLGLADELKYAASQLVDPKLEIPYQATSEWLAERYQKDKEEMDVFNEVENLRKGLFGGDSNSMERFKGIVFNANGGRPVEVRRIFEGGNAGIMIVRSTAEGVKQTEKIMFDKKSMYGGMDRLNDYLQGLNPGKYKVPTSRMVNYLDKAKQEGYVIDDLPDLNTSGEFDANLMLAYSLSQKGDTKTSRNGKEGVIKSSHKQAFVDMLDDLALQNKLMDENGNTYSDVEWDNGKLVLLPVAEYEGVEPEPVVLDPKTIVGQNKIKKLLQTNYEFIISGQNTTNLGPTERVGKLSKAGNLKTDSTSTNALLEQFEAAYKADNQ